MVIFGMIAVAAGIRLARPLVTAVKCAIEIRRDDMAPMELGGHPILGYIDGIWAPSEMHLVHAALAGGDRDILRIGKERIDTLILGGAPHCRRCRKLYLGGKIGSCPRCLAN
jgi:hypothetical protein